jgi:hypothetical protein
MSNQQPDGTPQTTGSQGSAPQPGAYGSPQAYPRPGAQPPAAPQYPTQAYPASPYGQPPQPYPGQGYGQPPQPYAPQAYGQPPQPYGRPPAQAGGQSPYQIPNYAAQYGHLSQQPPGAQPFPGQAAYQPIPTETRGRMLGMIAFVVLVLCVGIGSIAGFQIMQVAGQYIAVIAASSGTVDQTAVTQAMQSELVKDFPFQTVALNITGWLGLVAWIVGIVATVTRRGRLWGVLTIILGVLAPVIILAVTFAAIGPMLEALPR